MRIIAGEFRGRPLKAPKGDGTRPTADRVRESMMSVVGSMRGGFDDAVVLDAFAGSGALGLEALSRGARTACFYERAPEALRALSSNVRALGLDRQRARVLRSDVLKTPPAFARPPFDLVFLDPPYALEPCEALGLAAGLLDRGVASPEVIVVYEHAAASTGDVDDAAKRLDLSIAQRKKYGDTVVDVVRALGPAGGDRS